MKTTAILKMSIICIIFAFNFSNIFGQTPTISSQPSNAAVCIGNNTTFSVSASGTITSYQWQVSTDNGVTFTNITSAGSNPIYSGWNTATLSLTGVVSSNDGYLYRCLINGTSQVVSEFNVIGNGTWVCPSGVTSVLVECWGAGGGGGSAKATLISAGVYGATYGGGGGGGAYASSTISVTPGNAYPYYVPTFNVTSIDGIQTPTNGQAATFNTASVVAAGGSVGLSDQAMNTWNSSPGGAASASIGSAKFSGGSGSYPVWTGGGGQSYWSGAGGGGAGSTAQGGNASGNVSGIGMLLNGGNGAGGRVNTTSPAVGYSGNNYGGGGGGANASTGTNRVRGGYGAQGLVKLTYSLTTLLTSNNGLLTVNSFPVSAGTISGTTTVCQGQSAVSYTVPAITNATSYVWTLPAGATGTSSTNSITVNYDASATSGNITVKGNNSCGDGAISTLTINVNPLPIAAGIITGTATVCQGQNSVTYTVPSITNATSYLWTLPSGATGTSSTNTTNVTFGPSSVSGNLSVMGVNSCGSGPSFSLPILVNPLPPSTITAGGATSICQGSSVLLNANTGAGLTYQWKNNGTNITGATSASYTATSAGTYTVVVTNSNGCSATSAGTTVTVNPLPPSTITAGGATSICQGASVLLNANTGTGLTYQWKNNGTNITGATSASYTATSAGTYTVVVTNSNGCTATSAATPVTVNPLTTPSFTQIGSICSGGTLSALPTTSNNSIVGSWSPALNNTATTTYTFTPTSTASPTCATNTSMTIAVNSNPTATITAGGATSICQGSSVLLNANTGAGLTYQWKNNGTDITGATSASYTATSAGTYTVLVTNSNGCTATSAATPITVNPLTTPSFTQIGSICSGGTLSALPTTSNNSIVGSWSPALNNTATTTYTFTPTSTASPTCATNTTMTIAVNSNPTATITAGGTPSICQGSSVLLNANTGSGLTYQWKNNGTNITGATSASYTATSAGTYTVLVTNSNGCTATSAATPVTVNPLTTPSFTQIGSICSGGTLNALPTTSNNSIVGSWSPALNNTATTTYTFTPTSTASPACATNTSMTIAVNSLPIVNAGPDQTVCAGSSVTLNASGANTYVWDNGITNLNPFTPVNSALYTVIGTDLSTGCVNTDQVIVTVQALPNVNAGNDLSICDGNSITLNATGANSYSWSNSVLDGVSFTPTSTNLYTVTGLNTVTGCSNTDNILVTVNQNPLISSGPDQTICQGDPVTLSATGGQTYNWNNNVQNNVPFSPATTNTYIVSGTDVNGCTDSDTIVVTVNPNSSSIITQSALDSYTLNGQTYTQSGTYTQVIPNAVGCDSTITLNLTLSFTGLEDLNNDLFTLYPNPASEVLYIGYEGLIEKLEIIDMKGAIVYTNTENKKEHKLPLSLESGFYMITIQTEKGAFRKELVIQR